MSHFLRVLALCVMPSLCLAQTVTSSVTGSLNDPSGAAVPGVACTLFSQSTGVTVEVSSAADGVFVFPSVPPGTYMLLVEADGFTPLTLTDLVVTAREVRTLGKLTLALGEVREDVSVTVEAGAVQLATGERSGTVTGAQLNDLALKGRDFFALLQTVPGVVDTNDSRDTTSNVANTGIFINGARDNQKNFAVDGMVAHDTHSNGSVPFMPNMDAIAEVRVLTSNFQAEYGRNSGAAIAVVTKSGSRDFHGSAFSFYRNERLNANSFFNNRTGTPKAPYRYHIGGYSIGGPIYIPRTFNTERNRLFFFASQEFTDVKRDYGTKFVNVPTERERHGDFSRSFDVDGTPITVRDPLTGQPFPGNVIPQNRISPEGQAILNFFSLPNYIDPDPRKIYESNYRSVYSGDTPRRNTILRTDFNATSSLRVYYRFIKDSDPKNVPWDDWKTGGTNYLVSPVYVDNRGAGHLFNVTQTFSSTLVNEFSFGMTKVSRDFDYVNEDAVARSSMGDLSEWFPDADGGGDYVPAVRFGSVPVNAVTVAPAAQIPNRYRNPVYSITNNITKLYGSHSLKAGVAIERTLAEAPTGGSFRGAFDFGRDVNNPFDSGHGFANALLGNFLSYSESSRRNLTRQQFWNVEWFVQDNWRVSPRLTLDVGVRFYHMPPIRELGNLAATFDPSLYDPAKAPALYVPALNEQNQRVAQNPITGELAPAPLIGQYVLDSGDPANGMAVGGVNGYPSGLYTRPKINYAPRFGFAYDLTGDGKTALRGGWGIFFDTGQNNPFSSTTGNPPISYTPTLYYSSLDSYAQSGGAVGPTNMSAIFGDHELPRTMNFSLGIQRQLGSTVVDVSYVGARSRRLFVRRELNPVPMFSRFDPDNMDPTQTGQPLPDNFFRPYSGFGGVAAYENTGTSNYHALQVAVNRRYARGLQFGLAYTFSKALGVAETDTGLVSAYFPARSWNYGPLPFDRTHSLVFNYMYDLPNVGSRIGWKPAVWVLDNWYVSGVTSFITGTPFTPGFTTVDGEDITGSGEGARITVAGDPVLDKSQRDFFRNFNTEAFQRTPQGNFGNAGVGILRGPGINNWDISIGKRLPLAAEGRYIQFRAELFNAWNHTQFSGLNTTARFDAEGNQVDPNFGAYSSARAPRTIQLSLKVVF